MASFWSSIPEMDKALMTVSTIIGEATASQNPIIRDALSDIFGNRGKMLRPGLMILSARFGKKNPKTVYPLAAAVELLHTATLVHDDVIDDSPLRRGLPAPHIRFGKKDAVLIGDFLLSRCFLLAAEHTSPDNAVTLGRAISAICTMELEQDAERFRINDSLRSYLRKIIGKTALLFSLSCHVGALQTKAENGVTERLRRIGYNIGMAFQIIDDILDYTGDPDTLKKPIGNDLRAGLATLPLICALRRDDGRLRGLLRPQQAESASGWAKVPVDSIIPLVHEMGGVTEARKYAQRYTDRALREIEKLPDIPEKVHIRSLAQNLLFRSY
ncbi:MAG: polyprenyl synthetase family protein [Termitinemataceae bacterium]